MTARTRGSRRPLAALDNPLIASPQHWAAVWRTVRARSVLARTQSDAPERWRRFYDSVSDVWEQMGGSAGGFARRVAQVLTDSERLIGRGSSVLELGCGAGALSIELARRGSRVTALDECEGMLATLERRACRRGFSGINTVARAWTEYVPKRPHDLVLAAYFPPAWDPDGLARLESQSRGHCALVVPSGSDPFPLRRELWHRIMGQELPDRGPLLAFLLNYLLSSGRRPNLRHLSWPALLNVPVAKAVRYYAAYFLIFGRTGTGVEEKINAVVQAHVAEGRVRCRGRASAALLWWCPPGPPPSDQGRG